MRKEKKGIPPPPLFPHPRNNSLRKIIPCPSYHHLIKLFHFPSSLKPHIQKETL
jgi:hypothetical protein